MFEAWKEKRRAAAEVKWLEEIRARDADVGVPSSETLEERTRTAATKGMWDVVDDCLQKGVNVNDTLRVSRKWGTVGYLPRLSKVGGLGLYREKDMTLVCIAAIHNDVKAVQNLLAQGGSPSSGYSGWDESFTPLSIAVGYNNPAMVQLLCDNGADLSADRALRLAEKKGYNDLIKIMRAEEAKRAGGPVAVAPAPVTPADKVIDAFEKLSQPEREKLLAAVNEKFAKPKPAESELAQDMQVPKTITLKPKAQPDV